ncbi:MAG: VanZ family protein [Prevotellaceae bacterium]|jgi:VanZ family protein|nr:VanZ family protein [Prevotellaceae bacterium]
MIRFVKKHFFSIAIAAVIFYLSTATGKALPQMPPMPYLDKVVHIIMYMVLAGTLVWEQRKPSNKSDGILRLRSVTKPAMTAVTIALPILYGGLLELLQEYFFPPRTGDWWDFLADIAGVLWGVLICLNCDLFDFSDYSEKNKKIKS